MQKKQNKPGTNMPKKAAAKKKNAPAKKATPNKQAAPKKQAALKKKAVAKNRKGIVYLSPADLPLTDKWFTISELEIMFNVKRGVISRYRQAGILRPHKWGGTLRFNKTYVDWMIQNGGKKFTWLGWLLALTNNFEWVADLLAA